MFQAGSVITKVGADLEPLKNAFAGARREAGGFATAMNRTLGGVGQAFAGVAQKAAMMGTAIAGAGLAAAAGMGVWAVKLAADSEQALVSFNVMLGSVEKAKELMAEINAFAAKTPFETKDLMAPAKGLLSFGVAQKQIIPTMRVLGDLASGLNVPLGDLAQIYGKIRVDGRIMSDDLNQLVGRGIPVIQEFAKQFGVAESDVRKMVEQGKIGFPDLQRALVSLTGEGGRFAGMMDAQSKTMAGLWSTLKSEVEENLKKIGELITEKLDLKAAINGVSEAISAMATAVMPMIDGLISRLGESGKIGQRAGNLLLGGAELAAKGFAHVMQVVDGFRIVIKGLQMGFSWLWQKATEGGLMMAEAVAAVVNKAVESINWLIEQANRLPQIDIDKIDFALEVDRTMAEAIIQGQQDLRDELADEIGDLAKFDRVEKVGAFFDQVRAKAQEAADAAAAVGTDTKQVAIEIEKGMKAVDAVKKVKAEARGPRVEAEKPVEQETRLASLMRAGSAQAVQFAFQQKMGKDDIPKKQLAVSEAILEVNRKMAENLTFETVTV